MKLLLGHRHGCVCCCFLAFLSAGACFLLVCSLSYFRLAENGHLVTIGMFLVVDESLRSRALVLLLQFVHDYLSLVDTFPYSSSPAWPSLLAVNSFAVH